MKQYSVLADLDNDRIPLVEMVGVDAMGAELYRSPQLADGAEHPVHAGLDVLVVPPNTAFPIHVHPGHHVLYILRGTGTVMYDYVTYESSPGDVIIVPADVIHNVASGPDGQVILAFGAPHHQVHTSERMTVIE